jgi:hypothetical protein
VVIVPPVSIAKWPAGFGVGGPPLIGRGAANRLARSELAKPIYHEGVSLTDRVIQKIISFLGKLIQHVNSAVPGGWWALVALGVLAVIVLGVVLARLGPISLVHGERRAAVLGGSVATARYHRGRAQQLAAEGDWSGAIRELLRAIAADLEERAILPPRPGRTADELAFEAGHALPEYAGGLLSAARVFDDVSYGERPGHPDAYAQLRELDAAIHAARPLPLIPANVGDAA